ncbi:hypothetical protein EMPS_01720 [Entomortierella parvispora]|uniref:Uncharacterized protein n=1 Tax=Entomortierella parvispora TaxID=205924 RepID=A0A9P3H3E6_9FUNG|nr:hypothetical protein EMPS_01720 [Entomortierella parvispora]
MTMVYFGMQGSIAVIVVLPRLVVYGCILYSASLVPDFALSAQGFQSIGLAGYTSLEGGLLTSVLVAIAVSSVVHAVHLLRVTLCGIACALSVCSIGKYRRTLIKDLESRISILVMSAQQKSGSYHQRFDRDSKGNDDLARGRHSEDDPHLIEQDYTNFHSSEKIIMGREMSSISHGQDQRLSEDEFHQIDLGAGGSSHDLLADLTHNHSTSPYVSTEVLPMVSLGLTDYNHGHRSVLNTAASEAQPTSSQQRQDPPTETPTRYSLMPPTSAATSNSRLAALSFYDDLLKSISSERQILSSSMSNYALACDRAQNHRESRNLSIGSPSIALCSSIPLSYSSNSDYDDRTVGERPVHPFDVVASVETQRPMDLLGSGDPTDHMNTRTLNFGGGGYYRHDQLARCGSSNSQSQETIENWRIHVAPSSPTIPAIEYDLETRPDEDDQDYMVTMDRRGTIPIVLSRHLQEETTGHQFEDNQFFDAADLHIPRPLYAINQTRTQRQGSVNSSIGGYNYSTAASSPSLADSLSNPMYQQQSLGMLSGWTCPRPFPPRKGSLPSSISSSVFDSAAVRGSLSGHNHQQAHSHLPQHLASSTPHRARTRMPSNLSNVVDMAQDRSHPHQQQRPRTHLRSLSHGAESSGRMSGSSWEQHGIFEDAQVGYATLTNVPSASVSRLTIQDRELCRLSSSSIDGKPSISLQEALIIEDHRTSRGISAALPHFSLYQHSDSFEGETTDQFVHPLDLSPLSLQPVMESSRQREYNYRDPRALNPPQPAAWENTSGGIGLGLSFGSFEQQGTVNPREDNHSTIITPRPIMEQPAPQWMLNCYESNGQPSFDEMYRVEGDMTNYNFNRFMTQTDEMNTQHRKGNYPGDPQTSDYNGHQQSQQQQGYHDHDHDYDYDYDYDYDNSNFLVYYEPQQLQQQPQQHPLYHSTAHFPLQQHQPFQRQPSLRNKKNLVLNTAAL